MRVIYWLSLLLLTGYAQAANWVPVSQSVGRTIEVDVDSIHPDEILKETAHLKIRIPNPTGGFSEYTSTASCESFLLSNSKVEVFSTPTRPPVVLDYENDPDLSRNRHHYYGYTHEMGKAMRYACENISSRALQELKAPGKRCSNKDYAFALLDCSDKESWRVNFKLMLDRSLDLIRNCQIDQDALEKQFSAFTIAAMRCKDERCGNNILEQRSQRYGYDALKTMNWYITSGNSKTMPPAELCTSLNDGEVELVKLRAEQDAEKSRAATRNAYFECAKQAVKRLDDKTSGADVVARGAHGACSAEFLDFLQKSEVPSSERETIYKAAEPRLIEMVLDQRASSKPKRQ